MAHDKSRQIVVCHAAGRVGGGYGLQDGMAERGLPPILSLSLSLSLSLPPPQVWVADSFEGCPRPDPDLYPQVKPYPTG